MGKKSNKAKTPEHVEINTMGNRYKVFIKKRDIVHATTHHDPRNKQVTMADGTEHVFMNYTMLEIAEIAPHLLCPNHSVLLAPDIITSRGNVHVSFKLPGKNAVETTLIGDPFSKEFKRRIGEF